MARYRRTRRTYKPAPDQAAPSFERQETDRLHRMHFDRVDDLLSYVQEPRAGSYGSSYERTSFCPYTWSDTLRGLSSGWAEGSRDVDLSTDRIHAAHHEASAVSIGFDVTGDYIDIGSYLQGIPECWGYFAEETRPQEELQIVINMTFSGSVPQDQIFMRGAAITALVDRLVRSYFVKLRFVCYSRGTCGSSDFLLSVDVNTKSGYSRDLVAFLASHPGMLRRVFLVAAEKHFGRDSLNGDGYGYAMDVDRKEQGDIYFPANQGMNSIEAARAHVQGIIDKLQQTRG